MLAELADGAMIVECAFEGIDWLVREVLKEAGDAAVLEPADAREAVAARPPSALLARRCRTGEPPREPPRPDPHDRREVGWPSSTSSARVICATNGRDGWPHLMPLWYVVRDGELWAWTYAKSQKVRNLERDPRATLQVEAGDEYAGAARRDAAQRASRSTATSTTVAGSAHGDRRPLRAAATPTPRRCARWSRAAGRQARRAASSSRTSARTWDHRKLGGTY